MYEVEKKSKYHMIVEEYDFDTDTLLLDFVDYREYLDFIDNVLPTEVKEAYIKAYPYYRAYESVLDSKLFKEPLNQNFTKSYFASQIRRALSTYTIDGSSSESNSINRIIAPSKIVVFGGIGLCLLHDQVIQFDSMFFGHEISFRRREDDNIAFECLSSSDYLNLLDDSIMESVNPCCENEDMARILKSEKDSDILDLSDDIDFELVIKNVGQGNWNILRDDYDMHKKLYYDCGCSTIISKKAKQSILYTESAVIDTDNYSQMENAYRTAASQLIISHWHSDHINLISFMSDYDLDHIQTVIVPDMKGSPLLIEYIRQNKYFNSKNKPIPEISLSAQNILMRLMIHSKKVYLVRPETEIMGKDNKWVLLRGAESKRLNLQGLVFCFHNKNNTFILTGDNNWQNIERAVELIRKMQPIGNAYLVVPHHGGCAGESSPIHYLKFCFNCSKDSTRAVSAVVSVGPNGYGHPVKKYMDNVGMIGFRNIYSTQDNVDDIVVPEKRSYIQYDSRSANKED